MKWNSIMLMKYVVIICFVMSAYRLKMFAKKNSSISILKKIKKYFRLLNCLFIVCNNTFQKFTGKIVQTNGVVRLCNVPIITPAGNVIVNNFSIEVCER